MTAAQLRRRAARALALAVLAGLAPVALVWLAGPALRQAYGGASRSDVAATSATTAAAVSQFMDERRRAVELLAALPDVVHAARVAALEAKRRHLVGRPVSQLERELDATRALSRDPRVEGLLTAWRERFGFTDVSFSEIDGYAVLGTARAPDFVQSDEDWWQRALADGFSETPPQFDPSGQLTVELAARIADPATRAPMGVVRATLSMAQLQPFLHPSSHDPVEIVDGARRVVASATATRLLKPFADSLPPLDTAVTVMTGAAVPATVVAAAPSHGGRWWAIAHGPVATPGLGALRLLAYRVSAAVALVTLVLSMISFGKGMPSSDAGG